MIFGNDYETNLTDAGDRAQASLRLAGEERVAKLHQAMMQAHRVSTRMDRFGEPGTRGAVAAADNLELAWRTARDFPDLPRLDEMITRAANAARHMANHIPPRVDSDARNQAQERTQDARQGIREMAPDQVRADMRAEAARAEINR